MRNIVVVAVDPTDAVHQLYDTDVIGLPITIAFTLHCVWHHVKPGAFPAPFQGVPLADDPWFKWVLKSRDNYEWLWNYGMDIIDEHDHRFGSRASNPYKHGSTKQLEALGSMPPIEQLGDTDFPQSVSDMLAAYKSQTGFWVQFTNREKPSWATPSIPT